MRYIRIAISAQMTDMYLPREIVVTVSEDIPKLSLCRTINNVGYFEKVILYAYLILLLYFSVCIK